MNVNMQAQPGAVRDSFDAPSTPKASIDHSTIHRPTDVETSPAQDADMRSRLDRVLHSDIGINTLLTRLKQSISSARDFSGFLKERAALEEKHSNGIYRLTRSTQDMLGRPDNRQGSFAFNYREIGTVHEMMAKNSEEFTYALMAMADDLNELAANCERGRKQWKHTGLEAEQRAQDADSAMEKAKQRYYAAAEHYDRVRTGERQGGKFALKTKSAAAQEESLMSKADNADSDYRSRVEAAQQQKHELMTTSRPLAIRELQNLIMECDAAVTMQLQKFAVLNEKLLLKNGLCVSPLKNQDPSAAAGPRSLREIAQAINNQKDFHDFVLSHSSKVGPPPQDIRYQRHPALVSTQQHPGPGPSNFGAPQRSDTGFGSMAGSMTHGNQSSGIVANHPHHQGSLSGQQQPPHQSQFSGQQHHPQQGQFNGPHQPLSQGHMVGGHQPHQQGQFPVQHGPQGLTGLGAPQLPQIGALSINSRHGVEGGRGEPYQARNENDYRNVSGSPQHGPGQALHAVAAGHTAAATTVNQQVTSGRGPNGPGSPHSPNDSSIPGAGRGQPPNIPGAPPNAQTGPQPYQNNGRGTSISQPQNTSALYNTTPGQNPYQNGGRGTPSGQLQNPTAALQNPLSVQSSPQHGGRGSSVGQSNDFRPDIRDPQQGQAGYQNQPDGRGLPSQAHSYGGPGIGGAGIASNGIRGPGGKPNLPPLRPCFGVSLDELFRRDNVAVPAIVYQCVQAVDMFGLTTEGIYRIPGSAQHIMELQALFDHDASKVDFRSPASFRNDIASVTTLLKHFLRDLPDPLLTSAQYSAFIQAAHIEDPIVRRDSFHAIINSLPDPNYATLRTLVLHLNRVASKSEQNRMTANNLAIVFGPTLMGGHSGGASGEIQDAGWQARVVETILVNTFQIFDDDD